MATRSISISLEEAQRRQLDAELNRACGPDRPNRSSALSEALGQCAPQHGCTPGGPPQPQPSQAMNEPWQPDGINRCGPVADRGAV